MRKNTLVLVAVCFASALLGAAVASYAVVRNSQVATTIEYVNSQGDTIPVAVNQLAAAQQMAGEGKTLTDITPDNSGFIKRLYRIDETNNYIAYLVVMNDRYGRVECETMVYINENGVLNNISDRKSVV